MPSNVYPVHPDLREMRCKFLPLQLLAAVAERYELDPDNEHGFAHWRRVKFNGHLIAAETGANLRVVSLFALLHDSRRENDYEDPEHGPRAAELARELHAVQIFRCHAAELSLLKIACHGHTHERTHPDVTVQTCWDADRLDLARVGITPDPRYLCTEFARRPEVIAAAVGRSEMWAAE